MSTSEHALRWVVWILGAVLLTALPTAFLPQAWMDSIHRWLGLGELPSIPIIGYMARSLSLFYAMNGALLLFLAVDVRRNSRTLRFLGAIWALFGVGITWIDAVVGLPLYWVLTEGPPTIGVSLLILVLASRVSREVAPDASR